MFDKTLRCSLAMQALIRQFGLIPRSCIKVFVRKVRSLYSEQIETDVCAAYYVFTFISLVCVGELKSFVF